MSATGTSKLPYGSPESVFSPRGVTLVSPDREGSSNFHSETASIHRLRHRPKHGGAAGPDSLSVVPSNGVRAFDRDPRDFVDSYTGNILRPVLLEPAGTAASPDTSSPKARRFEDRHVSPKLFGEAKAGLARLPPGLVGSISHATRSGTDWARNYPFVRREQEGTREESASTAQFGTYEFNHRQDQQVLGSTGTTTFSEWNNGLKVMSPISALMAQTAHGAFPREPAAANFHKPRQSHLTLSRYGERKPSFASVGQVSGQNQWIGRAADVEGARPRTDCGKSFELNPRPDVPQNAALNPLNPKLPKAPPKERVMRSSTNPRLTRPCYDSLYTPFASKYDVLTKKRERLLAKAGNSSLSPQKLPMRADQLANPHPTDLREDENRFLKANYINLKAREAGLHSGMEAGNDPLNDCSMEELKEVANHGAPGKLGGSPSKRVLSPGVPRVVRNSLMTAPNKSFTNNGISIDFDTSKGISRFDANSPRAEFSLNPSDDELLRSYLPAYASANLDRGGLLASHRRPVSLSLDSSRHAESLAGNLQLSIDLLKRKDDLTRSMYPDDEAISRILSQERPENGEGGKRDAFGRRGGPRHYRSFESAEFGASTEFSGMFSEGGDVSGFLTAWTPRKTGDGWRKKRLERTYLNCLYVYYGFRNCIVFSIHSNKLLNLFL